MVIVEYGPMFEKRMKRIKNRSLQDQIRNQVKKIVNNPEFGKPMRYERKGTREVYTSPFRLSYAYLEEEDKIIFLDIYHKDEQ